MKNERLVGFMGSSDFDSKWGRAIDGVGAADAAFIEAELVGDVGRLRAAGRRLDNAQRRERRWRRKCLADLRRSGRASERICNDFIE